MISRTGKGQPSHSVCGWRRDKKSIHHWPKQPVFAMPKTARYFLGPEASRLLAAVDTNPHLLATKSEFLSVIGTIDPSIRIQIVHDLSKKHPAVEWLTFQLFYTYFDGGQHDRALVFFSEFFQSNPHRIDGHRALEYVAGHSPKSAQPYVENLLRQFPHDLFLLELLYRTTSACGDTKKAIQTLTHALTLTANIPTKQKFLEYLAKEYFARDDYESSLRTIQELLPITSDKKPLQLRKLRTLVLMKSPLVIEDCCQIMRMYLSNSGKFFAQVVDALDGIKDNGERARAWPRLLLEFPNHRGLQKKLDPLMKRDCGIDIVITTWKGILMKTPEEEYAFVKLCEALNEHGDNETALTVWSELWSTHGKYEDFTSELRRLRSKMLVKSGKNIDTICFICFEFDMDTVFDCGHPFCSRCARIVQVCPTCRVAVRNRIKVFAQLSHVIKET
jgi:tetratricopeptide (TPR) repeat protein